MCVSFRTLDMETTIEVIFKFNLNFTESSFSIRITYEIIILSVVFYPLIKSTNEFH